MTYSDATGSYEADFLENILDTQFRYGIPYKIDRQKYEAVMADFKKEVRVHDADVVVFHADYNAGESEPERSIYSYTFYAWPKNSPEGSDDFYDCSQFWDYDYEDKHKEAFESFVRAILETVIGPDQEYMNKLKDEKTNEKREIERQIADIDNIYREHFSPKQTFGNHPSMSIEEAKKIRACNGVGYSTMEFIQALRLTEPEVTKGCRDCWHNYHCPMPQEGYDYNPDTCQYNPDNGDKKVQD